MHGLRGKIGPPTTVGPFEAIVMLVSGTSLILTLIAMAAPSWKTFVDQQDNFYEVGLWSICKNGQCRNNWSFTSHQELIAGVNGTLLYQDGRADPWYFYSFTPGPIVASQAFYCIGVVVHMLGCGLWAGGVWYAFGANLIPAICYTIATACASAFFENPWAYFSDQALITLLSQQVPPAFLAVEWGYAGKCGFVTVILIWVAVVLFLLDSVVRSYANRSEPVFVVHRRKVKETGAAHELGSL